MKPGKHQRSKQRCQDLRWKVHDQARRRGGSKGSNEPPLKFDNGGLKYK